MWHQRRLQQCWLWAYNAQLSTFLTSKEAKLVHGKCSRGDLVLVESPGNQPQAAEVWMFCQVQSFSSAWALVQRLELVDVDASTDSATWTSLLPGNS